MLQITDKAFAAAGNIATSCMHCGGTDGHTEVVHTGDSESMDGCELWFCCKACNEDNTPCETFFIIPNDPPVGTAQP